MKRINIRDFVTNLTDDEIVWFDKNLIIGGIKNPNRPDLERGLLLYSICKKIKAKYCLDIGTANYFSAKSMAYSGSMVDTIDTKPMPFGKNMELAPKIVSFVYKSDDILPKLLDEDRRYDLVFIDGDHSYEGVKKDILNAIKLSDLIVCHDYGNLGGVTKAINEILKPKFYIADDRMWKGAVYENGIDRNGEPINYGLVIYDKFNKLGLNQ